MASRLSQVLPLALAAAIAAGNVTASETPVLPPLPAGSGVVGIVGADVALPAEEMPATLPGRSVVLDSRMMVGSPGERTLKLSDVDQETADIVREVNRKPGTWQLYLLYTAEDLPERMFHPGFAIRFKPRASKVPPDVPELEQVPSVEAEPVERPLQSPPR